MKALLIISSIIFTTIILTSGLKFYLYKKGKKNFFYKNMLPVLLVSLLVGVTIIPYGMSYPDPVGSGLTVMFGINLIIISIINVVVMEIMLKNK